MTTNNKSALVKAIEVFSNKIDFTGIFDHLEKEYWQIKNDCYKHKACNKCIDKKICSEIQNDTTLYYETQLLENIMKYKEGSFFVYGPKDINFPDKQIDCYHPNKFSELSDVSWFFLNLESTDEFIYIRIHFGEEKFSANWKFVCFPTKNNLVVAYPDSPLWGYEGLYVDELRDMYSERIEYLDKAKSKFLNPYKTNFQIIVYKMLNIFKKNIFNVRKLFLNLSFHEKLELICTLNTLGVRRNPYTYH